MTLKGKPDDSMIFYITRESREIHNIKATDLELQVFKCISGEYIIMKMVQNNIKNCINGDDESGLTCFMNGKMMKDLFCKTACVRPNCSYPDLYYQKLRGGWFSYSLMCDKFRWTVQDLDVKLFYNKTVDTITKKKLLLLITRQTKIRKMSSFTLNLILLNINDTLFGMCLSAIFSVDYYYGDSCVIHYKAWMNSAYCKVLGVMSNLLH